MHCIPCMHCLICVSLGDVWGTLCLLMSIRVKVPTLKPRSSTQFNYEEEAGGNSDLAAPANGQQSSLGF